MQNLSIVALRHRLVGGSAHFSRVAFGTVFALLGKVGTFCEKTRLIKHHLNMSPRSGLWCSTYEIFN